MCGDLITHGTGTAYLRHSAGAPRPSAGIRSCRAARPIGEQLAIFCRRLLSFHNTTLQQLLRKLPEGNAVLLGDCRGV